MRVVLSHDSAFEYWMNLGVRQARAWRPTKANALEGTVAVDQSALDNILAGRFINPDRTAHILLSSVNGLRRSHPGVVAHVMKGTPPTGSFVKVEKDLFVCSPALCLAQLGKTLGYGNLLKAAFWLCGIFGFDATTHELCRCEQAASVAGIRRFLERGCYLHGARSAKVVCRHALDRCASPRESDLGSFVFAPRMRGGFGLPAGLLNYAEDIPEPLRRKVRKDDFECDIYWPQARLDLEYDSDKHHSSEKRRARDNRREAALKLVGINVQHVSNNQVKDPAALDVVIAGIRKDLKIREPRGDPRDFGRQAALRRQLMGAEKWEGFRLYDDYDQEGSTS